VGRKELAVLEEELRWILLLQLVKILFSSAVAWAFHLEWLSKHLLW
jgi:hypothetical protein